MRTPRWKLLVYLVVIVTGLLVYSAIGLMHQ